MTDNRKYIKRGQALIIWDDPQRYEEEVAGANKNKVRCAVPVRRVAVCGPSDSKIDNGIAAVQVPTGNVVD